MPATNVIAIRFSLSILSCYSSSSFPLTSFLYFEVHPLAVYHAVVAKLNPAVSHPGFHSLRRYTSGVPAEVYGPFQLRRA
jgi:hypothetical protein